MLLTRGGGLAAAASGALVRIDPVTARVSARAAVPGYPDAVAVAGGTVWVADFRTQALWRFTPRTGTFTRVVTSGEPRDLAVLAGKVYVASDGPNAFSGTVVRYDAATGHREAGVEGLACAITSGEGVVWVAGCPYVDRLSTDGGPLRLIAPRLHPVPVAADGRERPCPVPGARGRRRLAVGAR